MTDFGYLQSPHYPNSFLKVHLPSSQQKFFLENAAASDVEMRAQWYTDEELAMTTEDTNFRTAPDWLETR
jgi:hypothetical protein